MSVVRAFGANSSEEEKKIILEKSKLLANASPLAKGVEAQSKEFAVEFSKASSEVRDDKEVALASCQVDGDLLRHCSERLRGDPDVVSKALENFCSALAHTSAQLRGDKNFVLKAVRNNGGTLQHASTDLKNDRDVVLEATKSTWDAFQFASEAMKRDKGLVLEVVKAKAFVMPLISNELKGDREVVEMALTHAQADMPEVWDCIDPNLHDKELLLMAVRGTLEYDVDLGRYCYDEAAESVQSEISWEKLLGAAESVLASPGANVPVLTASLRVDMVDLPDSPKQIVCEAHMLSGTTFSCHLPDEPFVDEYGGERPGPIVSFLAEKLLAEMKAEEATLIHIVFSLGEDVQSVTPWDWDRPLSDFVTSLP